MYGMYLRSTSMCTKVRRKIPPLNYKYFFKDRTLSVGVCPCSIIYAHLSWVWFLLQNRYIRTYVDFRASACSRVTREHQLAHYIPASKLSLSLSLPPLLGLSLRLFLHIFCVDDTVRGVTTLNNNNASISSRSAVVTCVHQISSISLQRLRKFKPFLSSFDSVHKKRNSKKNLSKFPTHMCAIVFSAIKMSA
jgi:hypothetical protein